MVPHLPWGSHARGQLQADTNGRPADLVQAHRLAGSQSGVEREVDQSLNAGGPHQRERRADATTVRRRRRRQHDHGPRSKEIQRGADCLRARNICPADQNRPVWSFRQLRRHGEVDVTEIGHRDGDLSRNFRQQSRERRVALDVGDHDRACR
ncbi:hypothetical protein [Amycolatopsis thermoflava]|uniref:hypothetical protein n=1 Tax=Amycolatopsis thermoflava TaxID=84480 RepID=UPI001ADEF9B3|nr:hypothetical protein [Amycolatopsis thermoflava]